MSFVKPGYALYPVEVLPEVQVDNVTTAGTEIARYDNYGRKLLEIRNLNSSRPAANPIEMVVHSDIKGEAQRLYSAAQANVRFENANAGNKSKIRNTGSIRIRSIGGNEANIISRWHVVVRNYNLLNLFNYGVRPEDALTLIDPKMVETERQRILTAAPMAELESVGKLPSYPDLLDPSIEATFAEIKEIDRQIPALAANGGAHVIGGSWISVPPGFVAVILSIGVDAQQLVTDLAAGTGPFNCCYLYISRDDIENYIRLDASAMPNLMTGVTGLNDFDIRMFIPAIQRFQVQIVNNHTVSPVVANLRVRIRYGLRKRTLTDHEKWSIPNNVNDMATATALIEKYGIKDDVIIGAEL
jgi:hypothetical protein